MVMLTGGKRVVFSATFWDDYDPKVAGNVRKEWVRNNLKTRSKEACSP